VVVDDTGFTHEKRHRWPTPGSGSAPLPPSQRNTPLGARAAGPHPQTKHPLGARAAGLHPQTKHPRERGPLARISKQYTS